MQVGSIVKCVYQFTPHQQYKVPIKGEIYVIRTINPSNKGDDLLFVTLEEIINNPVHALDGYAEPEFESSAFEELQPPMDISELVKESINEPVTI